MPHRDAFADLQRADRLPLSTLIATERLSGSQEDRSFLRRFYAQSGALAGMLLTDPAYGSHVLEFLEQTSRSNAIEAFRAVFGKDLPAVARDFDQFLCEAQGSELMSTRRAGRPTLPTTETRPLFPFRAEVMLTELAMDQSWSRSLAETRLGQLTPPPGSERDVDRLWGNWAWQTGKRALSRSYYAAAVQRGIQDTKTLFRFARLEREAGAPNSQVRELLCRILNSRPQHDDARWELALLELDAGRYAESAQDLTSLRAVKPEWSWQHHLILAYGKLAGRCRDEAFAQAEAALSEAQGSPQVDRTERLLWQIRNSSMVP